MQRVDQYELLEPLGKGASASIWEARSKNGSIVAVKLLHEEADLDDDERRRLEREARALNGITHPSVVRVLDFGVSEGTPYLVMERLRGMSLRTCLEGGVSVEEGLALARQLVAGLAAVHEAGVVHRDVKPANVFVTSRGLKLLDFGLAKFFDASRWGEHSILTGRGTQLGTPAYMPPELCFGEEADAASDVYSAGIVLFECVEGRLPFVGESRQHWVRMHATAEIPPVTKCPPVDAVLKLALAKRRGDRFRNAMALDSALQTVDFP